MFSRPDRALLALAPVLTIALLSGCQYLYPERDPEQEEPGKSDEPLFDAVYYAQNAKEYFQGGQYARAREQWTNQLKKDPGNWMAQLGLASCDYFLGSQALDRRDLKTGHELLSRAEVQCRQLWSGEIETDSAEAGRKPVQQWKAALVLARTQRALGDAADLQGRMLTEGLGTMKRDDARRPDVERERDRLVKQALENRRASLALFERLSAMEHGSEDAILNAAELHVTLGDADKAEPLFLRYLEIADASLARHASTREQLTGEDAAAEADPLGIRFLDEKIASNQSKQTAVMVRLGNIHFDRAERARQRAADPGSSPEDRRSAEKAANEGWSRALDYLGKAKTESDRPDLYVKIAQCQGALGLFDFAIQNLDKYIASAAERNDPFDDNLKRAYRMKREYEIKLGKPVRN